MRIEYRFENRTHAALEATYDGLRLLDISQCCTPGNRKDLDGRPKVSVNALQAMALGCRVLHIRYAVYQAFIALIEVVGPHTSRY